MPKQRQIKVATQDGMIPVPTTNETPETPYLAVTMTVFGQFEVTHVPSGLRLVGGFERAVNAFVSMLSLQLAFNELSIDASGSQDDVKAELKEKDKECESLGMTIRQWIALNTTVGNFCSEFPWETDEEGPHAELRKLMAKLKGDSNG